MKDDLKKRSETAKSLTKSVYSQRFGDPARAVGILLMQVSYTGVSGRSCGVGGVARGSAQQPDDELYMGTTGRPRAE